MAAVHLNGDVAARIGDDKLAAAVHRGRVAGIECQVGQVQPVMAVETLDRRGADP